MRVTQKTMYDSMLGGMNKNLSDYMESNAQGASMKRINRPSDDPAGIARVLSYRSSIQRTEGYESNAGTAQDWLAIADGTLSSLSTTIIRIKELAQQASTQTYSAEQRASIGKEIRELFGSIINMSNTEYGGKHIFAGQEYDGAAYREGLTVNADRLAKDANGKVLTPNPPAQVTGALESTALVRFSRNGAVPPAAGDGPMEYQWTTDGGKSWTVGSIPEGQNWYDVGGARITIPQPDPAAVPPLPPNTMTVKQGYTVTPGVPPDGPTRTDPMNDREGTSLFVRPTAIYQGSDDNSKPTISQYGSVTFPPTVGTSATGAFNDNVMVKLEDGLDWANDTSLSYSFSTDGGRTWTGGNKADVVHPDPDDGSGSARLVIPGGFLDLSTTNRADPQTEIPDGAQLIVQPQRTGLDFEIMPGQTLTVNNVGKNIFGGLYQTNGSDNLQSMFGEGDGRNLFETVGRLISYCETNDLDGIGRCKEEITAAHTTVTSASATIGGKINRLEVTLGNLDESKFGMSQTISGIEDVDLTSLLLNMTKQQMAYNTVLKSSSMIMQMNLTKFV